MNRRVSLSLVLLSFTLAHCECDTPLQELPEPHIELSDEDGNKHTEADPWLRLDFGDVDTGTDATRTLTVANSSDGVLTIDAVCLVVAATAEEAIEAERPCLSATTAPFTYDNIVGTELREGESQDVALTFRPVEGGPQTLFFRVASNDEDAPWAAVELTGRGTAGRLCTDVNALDFGDVYVGETKTLQVTLTNCGVRPLEVDSFLMVNNPDDVFDVRIDGNPVSLPIGPLQENEQVVLDVTFAPQQVRIYRDSLAGLAQATSAEPYYGEYTFVFEGTAVALPTCRLNVVPQTVQFGAVASNGTEDRDIIVQSVGACACQVTDIVGPTPGDAGFELLNPPALPFWVSGTQGCEFDDPGSAGAPTSVTIPVRYTAPDRAQPQVDNANIEFTTTDPEEPTTTVLLEANGGGTPYCQLEVTPEGAQGFDIIQAGNRHGLVSFGRVTIYGTKRSPIALTNIGNDDCTINDIVWDWAPNTATNEFSLEYEDGTPVPVGSVSPITIGAGMTQVFNAVFAPTHVVESDGGIFPDFSFGSYSGQIQEGAFSGTIDGYCNFDTEACNGVKFVTSDTLTTINGDLHGPGEFSIGFSATPVEPAIDVIPGELTFGLVTLGCGSPEERVNVYNTGSGDLVIDEPYISPDNTPADFVVTAVQNPTGTWPYTIPPGGSMGIFVRFYANQVGPVSGELVIPTLEGGQAAPPVTVPLSGEGTLETEATDIFTQFNDPKTDVLWVVDDSGSMGPFIDQMATNFSAFFTASNVNASDYHIAVTTTLTTDGNCIDPFGTQTCPVHDMCGHYTSCSGNDRYLTPASSNPDAQFQCNVDVDNSGNVNPSRPSSDSAEGALQAARNFLEAPKIDDPAINGGFLRDDAKLHVIMVSDEVDQSEGPVNLYIDFFKNIKGFRNDSLIAVSAIAVPASGCTMTDGTSLAGDSRYETVVDELNGRFQPICDADWTTMMQNLGLDSLGLQVEFYLTRAADAATLDVCVRLLGPSDPTCTPIAQTADGDANGYWYDPASNSIVFNPNDVPPRGAQIEVNYEAYCY